jgi:putative hydrolase of the HAD superfamily
VTAVPPPPEIIFFDVGDTLMRIHPSWTAVYLDACRGWGLDVDEDALAWAFAQALREGLWTGNGPFEATAEGSYQRVKRFDVRAMHLLGHDDLPDGFYRALDRQFHRSAAWHVFPDVVPALLAIERAGIRRAVISNWVWALPELLHDMELAHHFEAVIASARVGYEKPQQEIFTHALELTGTAAPHAWHVGDQVVADVEGASAVGIRPVLIDREDAYAGGLSDRPDVSVVHDLGGLLDLLGVREAVPEPAVAADARADDSAASPAAAG